MPLSFSTPHPLSKRLPPMLAPPSLLFPAYNRRTSGAEWGAGPFLPRPNRLSPSSKPKKIIRIKDPQTGHDVTEEILSAASVGQGRHVKSSAPKAPPMIKRIPLSCIPRPPPLPLRPRFNYRDPNIEFRRQNSYLEYYDDYNEYEEYEDIENETGDGAGRQVRIQYDRGFLLKLRNRPASRAKPADLPNLSHIQDIIKSIHSKVEYLFERGDPKRLVSKEGDKNY